MNCPQCGRALDGGLSFESRGLVFCSGLCGVRFIGAHPENATGATQSDDEPEAPAADAPEPGNVGVSHPGANGDVLDVPGRWMALLGEEPASWDPEGER